MQLEGQESSSQPRDKQKTTRLIDKKYLVDYSKPLGSGSYSSVYSAYEKKNPSLQLACKILSKQEINKKIQDTQNVHQKEELRNYIVKRIKSQIQISQKINHPNIVRFVYFTQTTNNIYIFMQRCEGGNLQDFIQMKGSLSQKNAIPILKDIVNAACLLYDLNITHRDIKTQNILLQNGRAKLADFGFAKQMREKDTRETGTGVGTILYMAPQLIFQQKPHYSIKCDVWSIGVVFYYILYGQVPWDATQDMQSFRLALRKPIQFNKTVNLSYKMKNLISKMLIFKDEDRICIKDVKLQLDQIAQSYGV